MPDDKIIHASALALVDKGKVMLCSRPVGKPLAGMLEFPGGKVEEGEMPSEALVREIKEELDIDIKVDNLIPVSFSETHYPGLFHVVLCLFVCNEYTGELIPKENQEIFWFDIKGLFSIDNIAPADIPFIKPLQSFVECG